MGSSEVRTLGIWGMGGIGKTTLATVLYAKLSPEFEVGCFLANVMENSNRHGGLEVLRNKLFSKLLENENNCFDAPILVPDFVMRRLGHKKVFIVLDDVATFKQLEYLIKDYDLLGPGSRVIVTTRNKQIFRQVDEVYEIKKLSSHQCLHLFCLNVFEEEQPKHGYEDLSRSAISYCNGIPLALKVLGASLRRRSKEAWESELRKLQMIQNTEIYDVLKLSYDALDNSQQDIFLDIACFFIGERKYLVTSVLEACEFFAASGIEVLLDKALITISDSNCIVMHDLIQQMGQEIVRQESIKDPGRRSRLWKHEEVHEVLKYNTGTNVVEGITLDLHKLTEDLYLKSNSFTKMTNMRFLKIHDDWSTNGFNVHLPNGLESLSYKLRYLHWDRFCLESLPSNFCAEQLVELHMPYSKVKKLWDGVQNLVNLKEIDIWGSQDLIEIPDLSRAEKLETFILGHCEWLHQLHPSMSSLPKLTHLQVSFCKKIERLNVHSKSLCELFLYGCPSLKEFLVTSEEIIELDLSDTSICALSSSIWRNRKLTSLSLRGCNNLDKLSDDRGMESITALDHYGGTKHNACKLLSIQALFHNIGHFSSLEKLDLSETDIESLPANIKNLSLLTRLRLVNCRKLISLPELPPSLTWLDMNNCWKLMSLPELPPLVNLMSACNCNSLETNFTQRLVLQHMLQSRIPYIHQQYPRYDYYEYFIFPRYQVTKDCGFRTAGSSITIPYLPLSSDFCGFILCIILSNGLWNGVVKCTIYQDDKQVGREKGFLIGSNLISNHVLFSYVKRWHVFNNDFPFKLEFDFYDYSRHEHRLESIKECGVFPVYASESGLKLFGSRIKEIIELESITQISGNESQPRANGVGVGGSNNGNKELEQLLPASKRRRILP